MASRSQLSQSQKEVTLTNEIVEDAVKAILILDHCKKPIKQSEILNCLNCKLKRNQCNELWKLVKENLLVMGMSLVECETTQFKAFLLVADSPDLPFMHTFSCQEEKADRTLLVIVLSFIFMKEGMVLEDDLFRHLSKLQIGSEESWDHYYFGNVKTKVQCQYVEQLYISRSAQSEMDLVELRWGQRAKLEIPMLSILEFVCKVGYGGKVEPNNWVSQYERATSLNI